MLDSDSNLSRAKEVEGYKVLPPCVLYGKIGQGGMGAVYRGRHLNLDIDVAVKCLKPDLTGEDEQFVVRFRREARSAARINHQNVVRVFDVSEEQGLHYIVMELVQGETARQRVQRKGQLAVGEALEIVYGAASGLGEAHSKGFIHRDIKPDNIMIASSGAVKVADLGLAKPSGASNMSMLSGTNLIMGTPQYMPPEQWENTATVTTAADVWALGATLYYLLVGGEAIGKESLPAIMQRIVMKEFPDVRGERPDVPDDVAEFIKRATQKEPSERFADAREMAQAIEQLTTRRQTLADNSGISDDDQNTLLSPPPAKTLAKIKFWLDEQAQGGGRSTQAEDATMVSPQSRRKQDKAAAVGKNANDAAQPGSKAMLWSTLVALLLVAGALAWWQPWRTELSPFAEVDRLERAGQFAEAIATANQVYAAEPGLTDQGTRLANLHLGWAMQLRDREDLRGSLEQIAKSVGFEDSSKATNLKRSVLAKFAIKVDAELLRTSPAQQPIARDEITVFRGRFASDLGRELRIAGQVVALQADGLFAAERKLAGTTSVPVEVTLVTGDLITLAPWTVVYAKATGTPNAASRPSDGSDSVADNQPIGVLSSGEPGKPDDSDKVALGAPLAFDVQPARIELRGGEAAQLTIEAPIDAEVLIDGVVVVRRGEAYVHSVASNLEQPKPVQVEVRRAGASKKRSIEVVRIPTALTLMRVAEFVGLRHSQAGKWATDLGSVQISGELNAVANRILINGKAAEGLAWQGNVFTLTAPLAPGANRIELAFERQFYSPVEQVLLVDRIDLPSITLAEQTRSKDSVASSTYALVVDVDEWTTTVEAVNDKSVLRLLRDANSQRFRGRMPIASGENRIVVRATNVLGKEARTQLDITMKTALARPAIRAVRVLVAGQQQEIRPERQVFFSEAAPLVIDTNDVNAVIRINDEPMKRNSDGTISIASRLSESGVTKVQIVLENGLGRSDAFAFFAWLDTTLPVVEWLEPKSQSVAKGEPFELSGTWSDAGGLERDASKLGDMEVRISPRGVAKQGTWLVKHPGLTESTTLFVEVVDRAGNTTRLPLPVTVR